MSDVFVAGSLHWDVVVDAPRLPMLDETLMGHSVAYRFGGKGGNQAVAAVRMGASVAMAGCVGRDDFGARLRAELEAAGVNHRQVIDVDGASGMSVAIVDDAGEYGAVVVSAANALLDADDIRLPEGLKVLLLQNEVPETVNLSLSERVSRNVKVVMNAAPARTVPHDLLARTDVLIVNRLEAAALTGAEADTLDAEKAALEFCSMGPQAAVVTLGADGLVVADGVSVVRLPAHRVRAESAHGAGDVFCGAFAAEIARGASLSEAARFGAAAAALAVSREVEARAALSSREVRRQMVRENIAT